MLAHVETGLTRAEVTHVYLHGAAALRRDLTHVRAVPDEPPSPG
jgi:chorismate mutase